MEEDDNAGIEVDTTSKKELAEFHRIRQERRRQERRRQEEEEKRMMKTWIRNKPDADGYFLLQLEKKTEYNDMFLTAEDASSLTIARK